MNPEILRKLDIIIPNPVNELNYETPFELLIATILSANSTDKSVNIATKDLFAKYDVFDLSKASNEEVEPIIRRVGSYINKTKYIIETSKIIVEKHNGEIPNDREFLESLPGVGRKTANVFLKNIYNVPAIVVDTHVARVSKRLGLVSVDDDVETIELKLQYLIDKDKWSRVSDQLLLFGRYHCKARNPNCGILKEECKNPVN